jgi:hypothetical protein
MQGRAKKQNSKEKIFLLVYISDRKKDAPWELKAEESLKEFIERYVIKPHLVSRFKNYNFVFSEMPLIHDIGNIEETHYLSTYLSPLSDKNKLSAIIFIKNKNYTLSKQDYIALKYMTELFEDVQFYNYLTVLTNSSVREELLRVNSDETENNLKEFFDIMKIIDKNSAQFLIDLSVRPLENILLCEQSGQLSHDNAEILKNEFHRQVKTASIILEYGYELPEVDITQWRIPRPIAMNKIKNDLDTLTYVSDKMKQIIERLDNQREKNKIITWFSKAQEKNTKEYNEFKEWVDRLSKIEKLNFYCHDLERWITQHDNSDLISMACFSFIGPGKTPSGELQDTSATSIYSIRHQIAAYDVPSTSAYVNSIKKNGSKQFIFTFNRNIVAYSSCLLFTYKSERYAKEIIEKRKQFNQWNTSRQKEIADLNIFIQNKLDGEILNFKKQLAKEIFNYHSENNTLYGKKVTIQQVQKYWSNVKKPEQSRQNLEIKASYDAEQSIAKSSLVAPIKIASDIDVKENIKSNPEEKDAKIEPITSPVKFAVDPEVKKNLIPPLFAEESHKAAAAPKKIKKPKRKKKPKSFCADLAKVPPQKQIQDYQKEGDEQYQIAQQCKDSDISLTIEHLKNAFSHWSHVKYKNSEFIRLTVSAAIELAECYIKEKDFYKANKEYQRALSRAKSSDLFSAEEIQSMEIKYQKSSPSKKFAPDLDQKNHELIYDQEDSPIFQNKPRENTFFESLSSMNKKKLFSAQSRDKEEQRKINEAREAKQMAKLQKIKKEHEIEKQNTLKEEERVKELLERKKEEALHKDNEYQQMCKELNEKASLTQVISGKKLSELSKIARDLKKNCRAKIEIGGSVITRLAILIYASEVAGKNAIEVNDVDFFVKSKKDFNHIYTFNLKNNIVKKATISERLIDHHFIENPRDTEKPDLYSNYTKNTLIKDSKDKPLKVELAVTYPQYQAKENLIPFTEQRLRFSKKPSTKHLTIKIDACSYLILVDKKDGFIERCKKGEFWLSKLPHPSSNITSYFDRLYGAYLKIADILSICDLTKKALSQEWQVNYFAHQLFVQVNKNAGYLEMTQLIRKKRFHKKSFRQSIKSFCMARLLHFLYPHALPKDLFIRPEEDSITFLGKFCKSKKLDEKAEYMLDKLLLNLTPLIESSMDHLSTRNIYDFFKKTVADVLQNMNLEIKSEDSLCHYNQVGFLKPPLDFVPHTDEVSLTLNHKNVLPFG